MGRLVRRRGSAWQSMYFTSMIAVVMEFAVLLKAEIYWPRPEGLAHRTWYESNPGSAWTRHSTTSICMKRLSAKSSRFQQLRCV